MPIIAAPIDIHIEPDREGFGEILDRLGLSIPGGEVDAVIPTVGARLIGCWVWCRRVTEQLPIALATVQAVGIVDGVPRFMPQDSSTFGLASPFHLEHLAALQPHQSGVRKVKRNREPEHAIRTEELLRQPGMRWCEDFARLWFGERALPPPRHQGAF